MLPIANRGAGAFIAEPDVCLTPPYGTPVAYVNEAFNAMASVFAPNVLTAMLPSLTVGSVIPTSTGDEAGAMHWTIKGAAVVTTSFVNVHFNFLPAATLCSLTTGNNGNAPLGLVAVPSATNVFAMRAPAAAPAAPLVAALDLAAALAPGDPARPRVSARLLASRVGLLDVRLFSLDVPALAHAALQDLEARGVEALVLDLRQNPGGDVRAALELAGAFLEPGALLCVERDADGDPIPHRARPGEPCRLPLLILVDRGTASASELFAGCLRAHGRALLLGERTWGKGAGQRLAAAASGGPRLEAAAMTLPDGRAIGEEGLTPDVAWAGAAAPAP